jgi:hypothetical protein
VSPSIVEVYPSTSKKAEPFLLHVTTFCFPDAQSRDLIRANQTYSFVVTDTSGVQVRTTDTRTERRRKKETCIHPLTSLSLDSVGAIANDGCCTAKRCRPPAS